MSQSLPSRSETLPPELAERLDQVCDRFEAAWKAGRRPQIEEHLEGVPEDERIPLLQELVLLDAHYRRLAGDNPQTDDYKAQFPTLESARLAISKTNTCSWPSLAGFEILGEQGRGGMGVVYKALDRKRNQTVALKTMQVPHAAALVRFKQEFRALADVSHRNLVMLYELVHDGVQWFFTMEFVEGTDFLTYVREAQGRLRPALRQLAEGVAALHAAGILHRDLKPHNVLVTDEGRVVLLDFGLAAELDRDGLHASTTQHLLGTIPYMSPEQGAAQPLSPASDWYSVGVILYEILTGRFPFTGSAAQILRDKDLYEPPPPRDRAGDVPEDLNSLCADLLRRQPRQRPGAAEILRRLGDSLAEGAPPILRRQGVSLVGREPHLHTLAGVLAEVRQGHTVAVYVAGRSGAGKSVLVQHFLDMIGGQNVVILSGQCYEQETVPFKAFDSLIDGLTRYLRRLPDAEMKAVLPRDFLALVRIFPVLRQLQGDATSPRAAVILDPQEVRRRAFAALRELLARLGDRRPLVLCIDDLQWGDAESAALMAELLRAPDPPVLLLLGCYRSEEPEASPFLRAWARSRQSTCGAVDQRELAVDALAEAEARQMALHLLGQEDPAAQVCAAAVARESGGNPFFVSELVRHVRTREEAGRGPILQGDVTLDQAVWCRVQRLPEGARNLLAVVAVAARPLRQEDALGAADLGSESLSALATLRANHLLRNVGVAGAELLATYHDRVRESVVAHLPPETVRRTHHRLAVVLEATSQADPELLAAHFLGAGKSAAAGIYYALAAERAAGALAFDRAAQLFRAAIRCSPEERVDHRAMRVQLADALANAGRGGEAAREYQAAMAGAVPSEALMLRRQAAYQWLISGHIDEGIDTIREVLREVGMKLPSPGHQALWSLLWQRFCLRLRGMQYLRREVSQVPPELLKRVDACWSACAGLSMVDPLRAAAVQALHLRLALQAGEPYRLARAMALEAGHLSIAGEASNRRVRPLLENARILAENASDPHARGLVLAVEGIAALLAGRWRYSLGRLDLGAHILRDQCTGVAWELDTARSMALDCLFHLGESAELRRRYLDLHRESQERGNRYLLTSLISGWGSFHFLVDDNPDGIREQLHLGRNELPQTAFHLKHSVFSFHEAQLDLYLGNSRAAQDRVRAAWSATTSLQLLRIQYLRIHFRQVRARCDLAAACAGHGNNPLLRSVERDAVQLEREKVPWSQAFASLIRAGRHSIGGDLIQAKRLLVESIARLEAADMHLYAAAASRRLGQLRGGDEGRALIEQADTWMRQQEIKNPARWTAMLAPGFPDD
jgi:tRNA A-37 threonylcarbamoyl transferase component Bud32